MTRPEAISRSRLTVASFAWATRRGRQASSSERSVFVNSGSSWKRRPPRRREPAQGYRFSVTQENVSRQDLPITARGWNHDPLAGNTENDNVPVTKSAVADLEMSEV